MIAALKSDNNSSKNDEDDEEDQFEKVFANLSKLDRF
jgi:hypothetical protein